MQLVFCFCLYFLIYLIFFRAFIFIFIFLYLFKIKGNRKYPLKTNFFKLSVFFVIKKLFEHGRVPLEKTRNWVVWYFTPFILILEFTNVIQLPSEILYERVLTYLFPIKHFYTPNHQKTVRFSDVFRGYRKYH